jgi:L-amino acid N-acyltransferase YncA
VQVRMATPADACAIADIYAPYVRDTVISFETRPPSAQEMRSRLTTTLANFPWLVITDTDRVAGYAYAGPHRARAAYRWCADVSLYLETAVHRRGHGRRIYTALLNLLGAQGYVNAYAGIAVPPAWACTKRWALPVSASSSASASNTERGGMSAGGTAR